MTKKQIILTLAALEAVPLFMLVWKTLAHR